MFLLALVLFAAVIFFILEQFGWGKTVTTLALTVISSEAGAWRWFANGYSLFYVLWLLIAVNTVNVLLDWLLVAELLNMPKVLYVINWINSVFSNLWGWLKKTLIFKKSKDHQTAEPVDLTEQFKESFKQYSQPKLLFAVFITAALPRFLTIIVGGTAIAIFLITYKKLGWPGWLALIAGVMFRIVYIVTFFRWIYQ